MKIDELQWKKYLISTDLLQNCKEEDGITLRFFEITFNTYHKRSDLCDWTNERALDFWQSFLKQNNQKKSLIYYAAILSTIQK